MASFVACVPIASPCWFWNRAAVAMWGQRGALRHLPQEPGHRTSDLHQPEPTDRPDHLLSDTWILNDQIRLLPPEQRNPDDPGVVLDCIGSMNFGSQLSRLHVLDIRGMGLVSRIGVLEQSQMWWNRKPPTTCGTTGNSECINSEMWYPRFSHTSWTSCN